MKLWMKALLLFCIGLHAAAAPQGPEPKWKIDLRERYEFQAFDRTINFRWTLHQGMLFISPEHILVYQVNRSRGPAKLAARDASGGSGNFILQIRVLNALDGRDIKSLDLPTNADFSKVMATRDGSFIVRTGDILYLYSANFKQIASRSLPLKRQAAEEGWQIGVSPSGDEIMLVHQQVFKRNAISPTSNIERAQTDVEILNAETLQLTRGFTLPSFWDNWSAGAHFLLTSTPQPSASASLFGLLDFDGMWSSILPDWYSPKQPCRYQLAALDHGLFAAFGCGHFSIFPRTGEKLFSLKLGSDDFVSSVIDAGDFIAIEIEHRTIRWETSSNIPVVTAQPLRLELYEFKSNNKPVISVPLHSSNIYYSISSRGDLIVGDGTSLAIFAPGH